MYVRTITEHQNFSESHKNKLQSVIPGAKLGHPYFIILQTRFFMGLKKKNNFWIHFYSLVEYLLIGVKSHVHYWKPSSAKHKYTVILGEA